MTRDKENTATWTRYKAELCNTCIGSCCMMPVEVRVADLVRLEILSEQDLENEAERLLAKQLIKQKIVKSYRESTGLFMLQQQSDGACLFLDAKTRRCTVYDNRPNVCRDFPERVGNRLGYCPSTKK